MYVAVAAAAAAAAATGTAAFAASAAPTAHRTNLPGPRGRETAERLKALEAEASPAAGSSAAEAEALKARGNEAMGRGAFAEAHGLYTDALVGTGRDLEQEKAREKD